MTVTHFDARTFKTDRSPGYLLKVCHSLMLQAGEVSLADHDLSFIQWIVLRKLQEGTAVTASSLCRQMRYDSGAFTRLLDQLVTRGFIERTRSNTDRRVVHLQLTAAGRRKVSELLPVIVGSLNDVLENFSKAEFSELTRLLQKLMDNLRAYEASQENRSAS